MNAYGFSDFEMLDCQIEGLIDLLEILYLAVKDIDGEDAVTVTGATFGILEYARRINETMQRCLKTMISEKACHK